jgi:hypothetical protein
MAIIIFIPQTKPEGKIAEGQSTSPMAWVQVISMAGAAYVFNCMYAMVLTMIAVFLAEKNIGDSSTAGVMGMVTTLGSMLTCFTFSLIYMRTKRKTPIIFSVIMGIGFMVLSTTINLTLIGITTFFMGSMYGLSYSYYLMHASVIAPPEKASLSISIANAAVMPYLAITCGIYTVLSIFINFRKFVYIERNSL